MTFEELRLIPPLLRAVRAEGYTVPTPIQQQAIPHILTGKDVLGCAQTGTGKTAAFALPILQRLSTLDPAPGHRGPRAVRVLVLSPTRELAAQIGESFATYGQHLGLTHTVIYGGVGQEPQVRAIRHGVDILVATPGRLLDLMGQGLLTMPRLDVLVLDEADRMLDMGFIHDVRRILAALPRARQTLLFSATMPDAIADLAGSILKDPVRVSVTPPASTADKVEQFVYYVRKPDKLRLLQHLLMDRAVQRVLVFTRTKHGANRLTRDICEGGVGAEAIHGNKGQGARERALLNFRQGTTRVLVATDIAARGIDVDGISHVINYELPNDPDSYVHRIGRTARAGNGGIAISFCDSEERAYLVDIQRLIRRAIPVVDDHPYAVEMTGPVQRPPDPREERRRASSGGGGRREAQRPRPQAQLRRPPMRDPGPGRPPERAQAPRSAEAAGSQGGPVGGSGMVALIRRLGERHPGPNRR